jgi:sec-independent protein translocase protein TatB
MFEISWSELLILGIVILIFVGPKDLPRFMNTLGRYAGIVRRHAQDFRRHFEEAMREAELADIKREVEGVRAEVEGSLREAGREAVAGIDAARPEAGKLEATDERENVARAAAALDAPGGTAPEPQPKPAEAGNGGRDG